MLRTHWHRCDLIRCWEKGRTLLRIANGRLASGARRHFGRPAHFYQSLSKALLKDDYSMLELLAINEKAVTADSQEDYASLQLPLLPPAIHLHHTDFEDHTALTAGGYPLTAIAISNNNQLVISFKNVSESTVIELEQQMDHNPSTQEGSETGRVTFKKGASGYQVKLKGLRTFS